MVTLYRYLLFSLFCVIILTSSSVFAEENSIGGARDFVTKISEEILNSIGNKNFSAQQKEDSLSELFDKYVDTNWMGQFILGKYNRSITNEERAKYISLYHVYLKKSYIPKFRLYSGENYKIVRVKDKGRGNFLVNVDIISNQASSGIKVDYRVNYKEGRGFIIRDIVGEGVSLIVTQRSDFGAMRKRKGMKFFLKKLAEKVSAMKKKDKKIANANKS